MMKNKKDAPLVFFSVLYFPDDNAVKNIENAIFNGYKVVVYINKVNEKTLKKLEALDVYIMGSNANAGLGVAFYELESYLLRCGLEYYIYFDQDTVVCESFWSELFLNYRSFFDNKTGLLFFTSEDVSKFNRGLVISSGCLFSVRVMSIIGFHDPSYFVEGVDYDFCLKVKKSAFDLKVLSFNGIDHQSLQDGDQVSFMGLKFKVRSYGWRRTKDFNSSQVRLFLESFRSGIYSFSFFFIKSIIKFNLNEFFSRIILLRRK